MHPSATRMTLGSDGWDSQRVIITSIGLCSRARLRHMSGAVASSRRDRQLDSPHSIPLAPSHGRDTRALSGCVWALPWGGARQSYSWREKVNAWKANYNRHANLVAGEPEPCPICDACEAPTFCYPKYGAICPELQCEGTTPSLSPACRTLRWFWLDHLWQRGAALAQHCHTVPLHRSAGVFSTSLMHCAM